MQINRKISFLTRRKSINRNSPRNDRNKGITRKEFEIVINVLYIFMEVEKHMSMMKRKIKGMKMTTSEDEKWTLNEK